jgi:hypothetical protein
MRPYPNEMRSDAREFREQHANVLRALGSFQAQQFFHGEAVAQVV